MAYALITALKMQYAISTCTKPKWVSYDLLGNIFLEDQILGYEYPMLRNLTWLAPSRKDLTRKKSLSELGMSMDLRLHDNSEDLTQKILVLTIYIFFFDPIDNWVWVYPTFGPGS